MVKVLVVEDYQATGGDLSDLLKLWGYAVDWARTVAEGVALLDRRPEVVISDLLLPDGDGETLLEAAREKLPRCKRIAYSAYVDVLPEDRNHRLFELADVVIVKTKIKSLEEIRTALPPTRGPEAPSP